MLRTGGSWVRSGFVAVAFPVVLLSRVAAAQLVVQGTGDPAIDAPAVQAAVEQVDQGGSILLVGTFDFGDTGRVLLTKDVEIVGQMDSTGSPLTKIVGGDWPLYSPLPAMPPTAAGPNVTVANIHFEGAKGVAIHLAYTGGASIRNNRVTGMRGREFAPNTAVIHADPAKADLLSGGITVGTSHFVVFQNTVMGEATSGIRIGGNALGLPRINNVLKANNITKMSPFRAHVLLDEAAQHNTIVGDTGTVIDGGADNAITGFRPVRGGVGQAVSDAEQYWHDVIEILE
jgi:hypothetical protein